MAYWQRRKDGRVYVYSKGNALPRAQTKHLDGEPNHNIDAWTNQYEEQFEGKQLTPGHFVYSEDALSRQLRAYIAYQKSRGKADKTTQQHESLLIRYVVPFFLDGDTPLRDPNQWPGRSIRMLAWLEAKGVSKPVSHRCNVALRGFYRFLSEEGNVQNGLELKLRSPALEYKKTPLKTAVTPEAIFDFVNATHSTELQFLALAGYFFSLRPQEVFALTKSDFRAGSRVQILECAMTMKRIKLYEKFVVNVQKQRTNDGKFTSPKSYSKGWACCFSEEAARLIVEILKPLKKDEQVLSRSNRELYRVWGKDGISDVTLKDLRRASLYHLGHKTGIQPVELMKHARHKSLNTTMLYLRRPEEDLEPLDELDLEA